MMEKATAKVLLSLKILKGASVHLTVENAEIEVCDLLTLQSDYEINLHATTLALLPKNQQNQNFLKSEPVLGLNLEEVSQGTAGCKNVFELTELKSETAACNLIPESHETSNFQSAPDIVEFIKSEADVDSELQIPNLDTEFMLESNSEDENTSNSSDAGWVPGVSKKPKRGRPRTRAAQKHKQESSPEALQPETSSNEETSESSEIKHPPTVKKPKRGRPRKVRPKQEQDNTSQLTLPRKRGRGRPRKHPVKQASEKPGRRGRPCKNPEERAESKGRRGGRQPKYPAPEFADDGAKESESTKILTKEIISPTEAFFAQNGKRKEDGMWQCLLCTFPSHSEHGLRTHLHVTHFVSSEDRLEDGTGMIKLKRYMECSLCGCGVPVDGKHRMKMHMINQHGIRTATSYPCKTCSKTFPTAIQVRHHEKRVHQCQMVKCTYEGCGAVMRRVCLKLHIVRAHTEKNIICDQCGLTFSDKGLLMKHLRDTTIHGAKKQWVCDWEGCGKAFMRSGHLKVHRRIHTGEKPFQCELCGFCGSQYGNISHHYKVHHPEYPAPKRRAMPWLEKAPAAESGFKSNPSQEFAPGLI